jgi:hypothetical protein
LILILSLTLTTWPLLDELDEELLELEEELLELELELEDELLLDELELLEVLELLDELDELEVPPQLAKLTTDRNSNTFFICIFAPFCLIG